MTSFMEQLSEEYVCGKTKVLDDGAQPNLEPNATDCKTEDSICFGEISACGCVVGWLPLVVVFGAHF